MRNFFFPDQMVNSKNNSWLALIPQNIPILMKTKNPVYVMVFGVVISDGDVMTSFIFSHGCIYQLLGEKKIVPFWIERGLAGRPYV